MSKPHKQLTVVIGLVEKDGKFLVIRRHEPEVEMWHQKWEFPGGKINQDESVLDALCREVKEETGLDIHEPELLGVHTHHWDHPKFIQQTFIIA